MARPTAADTRHASVWGTYGACRRHATPWGEPSTEKGKEAEPAARDENEKHGTDTRGRGAGRARADRWRIRVCRWMPEWPCQRKGRSWSKWLVLMASAAFGWLSEGREDQEKNDVVGGRLAGLGLRQSGGIEAGMVIRYSRAGIPAGIPGQCYSLSK